ncbi:MAG: nucleotidyltransferase domain-containing protein [Candidatus Pacearchaeota archaeon]
MLQISTMSKVLSVFFENPSKKFNLKEISTMLNLAHTSVKNELNSLIKQKFILVDFELRGKRKFPYYFVNLSNDSFFRFKKLYNLFILYDSGVIEFLKNKIMPNSIVLFGSFSRGEDLEESDIDLFIESEIKVIDLKKFEKKLKRKINLNFNSNINNLKKPFLNNLINGIVLYGGISLK